MPIGVYDNTTKIIKMRPFRAIGIYFYLREANISQRPFSLPVSLKVPDDLEVCSRVLPPRLVRSYQTLAT